MTTLYKISNGINKIIEYLTALMLAGIVVSLFAQVIYRFVFNTGLTWSEELSRYLHMWITFLGASIIFKEGKHLKLTFLIDMMPRKMRKAIEIFNQLFLIFFFVVLIYYGINLIEIVKNQLTPAMQISTAWVYSSLPVGAVFMLFQVLINLTKNIGAKSTKIGEGP